MRVRGKGGQGDPDAALTNGTRLRNVMGQLITFIAVAEVRHFRRAAISLGKSQSVVTSHIQDLEEVLNVRLFVRDTRSVHLTPEGRLLLERAVPIVDETRTLLRAFRNQSALMAGKLRISVSPTVAIGWVPKAIQALAHEHPMITVSIREDMAPEMFEAVVTGVVSFGIGPFSRVPSSVTFTKLTEQHFCVAAPPRHPVVRSANPISVNDVPTENILCAGVGTSARELVETAFARSGRQLRPRHEAQHVQAILGMVQAGLGIAIIPYVGRRLIESQGLRVRMIQDPDLKRDIGLIEPRRIGRSPAAGAFAKVFPLSPD